MARYQTVYCGNHGETLDSETWRRTDEAITMVADYATYRELPAYVVDTETGEVIYDA